MHLLAILESAQPRSPPQIAHEHACTTSPGPAGEKISKKLSDHELMTWLLAAAGYSSGYGPYGFEVRHACDGWDGVNLRRVCGAATAEDADWEEDAFEASDHSDEFGDRDEYEDEDEDGSEGGGRSEDPYGHPWYL
jgi:hypothetical protein